MAEFVPMLQIGQWGICSLACGGGIQSRTVQCMDEFGQAVGGVHCTGLQPADQLQCNVFPCNFCSTTNCAGQACYFEIHHMF